MLTGDADRRRSTLRLRAADAELHGEPGEAVIFRLFLLNGLQDSEVFSYSVDALDGEFEGDLRAPTAPVAPRETVELELEIEIPGGNAPGKYAFQVAAFLSRDNAVGVAQNLVVTVDAPRSSALPWVAGAVGAAAIGILGLLLITQLGSGDSESAIVLGRTATPTNTARSPASPNASAATTPAPTGAIDLATPTQVDRDGPTPTVVLTNGAPSVAITSPVNGQVFCPHTPNAEGVYTAEVPLLGDVSDEEDGVVPNDQISWTFSLNGEEPEFFANSATVSLELHVTATTSNTVGVVLKATDSDGLSSETAIELSVGGPQTAACL